MSQVRIPTGGGDWSRNLSKGVRAATQARDAAQPSEVVETVNDAAIPEKPVIERQVPVASVTETVPSKTEAPVAVPEVVQEQPITSEKPKPRVVRADTDDTLIEIPGMQSKSVSQIKFELKKSQDLTRTEANLRYREEQLQRERDEFAREREAKVEKPQPVIVEELKAPEGAVPGDPEYEEFIVEKAARKVLGGIMPELGRITADMDRRAQFERETQQNETLAKLNIEANQRLYDDMLQTLPFDVNDLPEQTQIAVMEHISSVAADVEIDLKRGSHLRKYLPTEMRAIFRAAFPPGSLPPGYAYETETEAMKAVREMDGKPLVSKDKPVPLHQPGAGAIAVPKASPVARSDSWASRLDQTARQLTGNHVT